MSYRIGLDLGGTKVLGIVTDNEHKWFTGKNTAYQIGQIFPQSWIK